MKIIACVVFSHDEGRIRVAPLLVGGSSTFVLDFYIKDHLGNIRMNET